MLNMFKSLKNIKIIYYFTIVPRILKGNVKYGYLPSKSYKSPRVMTVAGKSYDSSKDTQDEEKRKERAKAQRIIDYVFGEGEFPANDIPDYKNIFDVHKDQLAQIVAPQVHLRNDIQPHEAKKENKPFIQKLEKFYETPSLEGSRPKVRDEAEAQLEKNIENMTIFSQVTNPAKAEAEENCKSKRRVEEKDEQPTIVYDFSEQMSGPELADVARKLMKDIDASEPIYPGHIKRLYKDPYFTKLSDEKSAKLCEEVNKILSKYEEDMLKNVSKSDADENSLLESTNQHYFKSRWKNEGPTIKVRKLSRSHQNTDPFALHKKLRSNLKKHMTILKAEQSHTNENSKSCQKVTKSKEVSTNTETDAIKQASAQNVKEDIAETSIGNQKLNANDSEALLSDINKQSVEVIEEDVSKKILENAVLPKEKGKESDGPHTISVNASTAGTIMYSETCSAAAGVKPSSPCDKTSRFGNPRDLDIDIEPVFPGRYQSKSERHIDVDRPVKFQPEKAIQETLDIAKNVVEESRYTPNNTDIVVELNLENLIKCPISDIIPRKNFEGKIKIEATKNNLSHDLDKRIDLNTIQKKIKSGPINQMQSQTKLESADIKENVVFPNPELVSNDCMHGERVLGAETDSDTKRATTKTSYYPSQDFETDNQGFTKYSNQAKIDTSCTTEQTATPKINASIVPCETSECFELEKPKEFNNQRKTFEQYIEIETDSPNVHENIPEPVKLLPHQKEKLSDQLKMIRKRLLMQSLENMKESLKVEAGEKPQDLLYDEENPSYHPSQLPDKSLKGCCRPPCCPTQCPPLEKPPKCPPPAPPKCPCPPPPPRKCPPPCPPKCPPPPPKCPPPPPPKCPPPEPKCPPSPPCPATPPSKCSPPKKASPPSKKCPPRPPKCPPPPPPKPSIPKCPPPAPRNPPPPKPKCPPSPPSKPKSPTCPPPKKKC